MVTAQSMHMANSYDPARGTELSAGDSALITRRQRVMGSPYRLFYERPLHLVRGEGVLLYDAEGQDYLDAYNNVPVVGHSNPLVQQRVSEQLGILNTHTRYLTDAVVDYAERLTALFPAGLEQAVFVCTGSEAVDLSLRMARHVTGRRGVIATAQAYHGTTEAAAAISPSLGANNPIPDEVELVQAPDLARESAESAALAFAERVRLAAARLEERGHAPAALIVDSIMSSDGLQGTASGVIDLAAHAIQDLGGLYIADEVQPGFGRTGSWWGFSPTGVTPDLVVLGKPMGNGIPIAAVVGREEVFEQFGRDMRYFNTFGGNPVSIAAANAVLDELCDRELVGLAGTTGAGLLEGVRSITDSVEDRLLVRGAGLFLALEVFTPAGAADPDRATHIVNIMREERVLISASGPEANVLKIRPPLVFTAEHAPRLLEALELAISRT